jgi:hypothetical protein
MTFSVPVSTRPSGKNANFNPIGLTWIPNTASSISEWRLTPTRSPPCSQDLRSWQIYFHHVPFSHTASFQLIGQQGPEDTQYPRVRRPQNREIGGQDVEGIVWYGLGSIHQVQLGYYTGTTTKLLFQVEDPHMRSFSVVGTYFKHLHTFYRILRLYHVPEQPQKKRIHFSHRGAFQQIPRQIAGLCRIV